MSRIRALRLLQLLSLLLVLTTLARVGRAQCQTDSFAGAAGPLWGAVAIDGDTLVVSVSDRPSDDRRIEIFRRQAGLWTSEQVIVHPPSPWGGNFDAIALSGDTLAVGSPYDDHLGHVWAGKVQVYERNAGVWSVVQELFPDTPADNACFGAGVALEGDTLVVGQDAFYSDVGYGSVHVFTRAGGVWTRQAELPGPFTWGSPDVPLDLDGDRLLVGAPGFLNTPGQAFLYERTGSSWSRTQRFVASDQTQWNYFGYYVALEGGTAVISSGLSTTYPFPSLYVFQETAGAWPQVAQLPWPDPANASGLRLSLRGDRLLAGDAWDGDAGTAAGAIGVYRRLAGVWTQTDKLYGADAHAQDRFGQAFAESQGTLAVLTGVVRGLAYVFALDDPACPDARFAAAPTRGPAPLQVAFTDQSGGGVASWSWSFGDGVGSFAQHPAHTYASTGRNTVELLASGPAGVDRAIRPDLVFAGHLASAISRNGSGVNPACFTSTGLPMLGGTWTAEIDANAHAGATATLLLGWTRPGPGWLTRYGEFLVDLHSTKLFASPGVPDAGGIAHYAFPIPNDLALDGYTLTTQGGVLGGGLPELCNAVDLVTGL